jgi:hypothetical protein
VAEDAAAEAIDVAEDAAAAGKFLLRIDDMKVHLVKPLIDEGFFRG